MFPVIAGAGCWDAYESVYGPLTNLDGSGGTGGTGGTSGSGGTPLDSACVPANISAAVDDGCGVFVSSSTGSDTNPGTKDRPLATLSGALAKGGRVYACADPEKPFVEPLEIDGTVVVFGGLDCATWKYASGTRTKWTAPADELPLRAMDGATIELADMAIEAADAVKDGGSSIAILAEAGATVDLLRATTTARAGSTEMIGAAL